MENVTHSLVGLMLARTGMNRWTAGATAVLILSANAPDADIVAASRGALTYLEVHRGYSHSFICLPAVAAIAALIVFPFVRRTASLPRLFALACVGVLSHLLLDLTNTYGIRLFLPFSSRWFHLDISNLWDGVLLAVLIFAALWTPLVRLVSSEIGDKPGRGRGLAVATLTFYLLFECARGVFHAQALAKLSARLYGGNAPLNAAAMPLAVNPFSWTGIVDTGAAYYRLPCDLNSSLEPEHARTFYKPAPDIAIHAAANTEAFRFFRYFNRFPVWTEEPVTLDKSTGTRVELSDLRFGQPRSGSFHSIAVVDHWGRIVKSYFTYGPGD